MDRLGNAAQTLGIVRTVQVEDLAADAELLQAGQHLERGRQGVVPRMGHQERRFALLEASLLEDLALGAAGGHEHHWGKGGWRRARSPGLRPEGPQRRDVGLDQAPQRGRVVDRRDRHHQGEAGRSLGWCA